MEQQLREIGPMDANRYFTLLQQLDEETSFLLFEAGERCREVEIEEKKLQNSCCDPASIIIVAEENDVLVGFIAVSGSEVSRIKHRASIVIGILQANGGNGLGKRLYMKAEAWAKDQGITRLEITVMTHNKRALWFFSSMGFQVEGIRRKSLKVNGIDADEFYMSKLL